MSKNKVVTGEAVAGVLMRGYSPDQYSLEDQRLKLEKLQVFLESGKFNRLAQRFSFVYNEWKNIEGATWQRRKVVVLRALTQNRRMIQRYVTRRLSRLCSTI